MFYFVYGHGIFEQDGCAQKFTGTARVKRRLRAVIFMYKHGDWVKIEYGEYAGAYGKIAAVNKDGSYRVLPYSRENEPRSIVSLNGAALSLLPGMSIDRQQLIELSRAHTLYRDIADRVFPIFNLHITQDYKLQSEDISDALKTINKEKDPLNRFKEWFWLIQNVLYDNLEIESRYNNNEFSDAPESSDQLFSTVYSLTEDLYWKLEERFVSREDAEKYIVKFDDEADGEQEPLFGTGLEETAYKAVCDDIISRVQIYEYNQQRPRDEWIYSVSQKRHIISSYETDEELRSAGREQKALYRQCVQDLYKLKDAQAMRILAWGYFEGRSIYRQSFKQAEKYLTALYKTTGDPKAAHALGYINYYGLSKSEADYEKAFQYFSYGSLAGIDESLYRTAEMLIRGQGTIRNVDMGMNLIVDGYKDTMYRFSDGEYECRFAEYALCMGNICMENMVFGMGLRDAYKFLLEAEFAVKKRMETGIYFDDADVAENIQAALKKVERSYKPDNGKNVLKADFPVYISQLFDDQLPIRITLRKEKSGYSLKVSRFRIILSDVPKILVTFPELSYVNLVSELTYQLEDVGIVKIPEKGDTFLADGFNKNVKTGALEFYFQGECIAAVEAKWFVIDMTKEKLLKKMDDGVSKANSKQ